MTGPTLCAPIDPADTDASLYLDADEMAGEFLAHFFSLTLAQQARTYREACDAERELIDAARAVNTVCTLAMVDQTAIELREAPLAATVAA